MAFLGPSPLTGMLNLLGTFGISYGRNLTRNSSLVVHITLKLTAKQRWLIGR